MSSKLLKEMFITYLKEQPSYEDALTFLSMETNQPVASKVDSYITRTWERLKRLAEQLGYDRVTDQELASRSLAKTLKSAGNWGHYEVNELAKHILLEITDGKDS